MLKKNQEGIFVLEEFEKKPEIIHGFSGRDLGTMNPSQKGARQNIKNFAQILGFTPSNLVLMEQVHNGKVQVVGSKEKGIIIKGVDSIITSEKNLILGTKVADCLPIFLYNPVKKIIGVVHAGWQGIIANIIPATCQKLRELGSNPGDFLVGVGPHIGGCCFTVTQRRAEIFQKKFGNLAGMLYKDKEGLHLDLATCAVFQLKRCGVRQENIEAPVACTPCQNQDFFSFRKERTNKRILGVIGLRKG